MKLTKWRNEISFLARPMPDGVRRIAPRLSAL
jgi:hypothetical protein